MTYINEDIEGFQGLSMDCSFDVKTMFALCVDNCFHVLVEDKDQRVEEDSDSDFQANIDEDDNRSEVPSDEANDDDDALSGYESDNHCEHTNWSDEELDNDPLQGGMDFGDTIFTPEPGEKIKLKKGQVFTDVYQFRQVLKDYTIQEGFHCVRDKNEKQRVRVHCGGENCAWRLHASTLPDNVTYMIKVCPCEHTCTRGAVDNEVSAKWLASKLMDLLRSDPDANLKAMRHEVTKYGVKPQYMQFYRAKSIALDQIQGNHAKLFEKLPYYGAMVLATNPGSVVTLQCDVEDVEDENGLGVPQKPPTFKRFFMGLAALRDGFLSGCNPFIGFDGCHLKGPYGGVLLSAIALDGNNGLYPIAFAIVETENRDSWSFFFHNLTIMLGGFSDGKPWTFMTDRQKGLVETISEMAPNVMNRRCARHICANFRTHFAGGALKKWFWSAARSYTPSGFNFAMYKMKELNVNAYKWLLAIPSEQWSRYAFDKRLKNDHVTNNISESFNNWIEEFRPMPFLSLLDGLRCKLMKRLTNRAAKGQKSTHELMPTVVERLNIAVEESRKCEIVVAGNDQFEIKDKRNHFVVNLSNKRCDCEEWDLSGLPCKHAIVAIKHNMQRLEDYTDKCFSREIYMTVYSHFINPVNHPDFWPEHLDATPKDLQPPTYRRLPGRPKKNRRKEAGEGQSQKISTVVRCKRCKGWGHNIRTCKGPTQSRRGATTTANGENTQFQASSNPERQGEASVLTRRKRANATSKSQISAQASAHHAFDVDAQMTAQAYAHAFDDDVPVTAQSYAQAPKKRKKTSAAAKVVSKGNVAAPSSSAKAPSSSATAPSSSAAAKVLSKGNVAAPSSSAKAPPSSAKAPSSSAAADNIDNILAGKWYPTDFDKFMAFIKR
ncbi:PREDICTED: uncharacterized protein LOC105964686 [Erythranthe guttata]|uniref:uncharacterized protein LOC105964686 n=1 Tax=Erythranthe guttata TaxID=4155 RepID=UPI00064DD7B4|nr:PREDICTED: uncharacterized protein LOC105964686 [Erythranthe guttata]|eukprot:XP_012844641.1 PREDICTED: uncharacterized protein LOC105964686 [Erythranthe guttata]